MTFLATPRGIKVAIESAYQNREMANILHVDAGTTAITYLGLLALAERVYDAWAANVQTWVNTDMVLRRVICTDISEEGGSQATYGGSTGVAGSRAGQLEPPQVAAVVTLYTARTGRSYRGRVYLSGLSELDVNGGGLADAAVVGLKAGIEAVRDAIPGATTEQLAILSTRHNGVQRTAGVLTIVSGITIRNNYVGTQRRRQPRP